MSDVDKTASSDTGESSGKAGGDWTEVEPADERRGTVDSGTTEEENKSAMSVKHIIKSTPIIITSQPLTLFAILGIAPPPPTPLMSSATHVSKTRTAPFIATEASLHSLVLSADSPGRSEDGFLFFLENHRSRSTQTG
ncbi:hypothetical protein BLNAU_17872 [Blattamonas nauphoetae]|uniref:Uncharacterized protein n=1 Tax=Blattamonas nauphoetae TaxID=2049346 RepID=A0ABQ9X634_9EUKA|nr:hypothetical protein BLNAU_17872 [Blattamonas nauphoetae]